MFDQQSKTILSIQENMKTNLMGLCTLLMASICTAAELQPSLEPTYVVKQPVIGSMLSRPVVSGRIPFDKTYAELTSEQKNVLREDYDLGGEDEPPFPMDPLKKLVIPIFKEAATDGVDGRLVLTVEIDSTGNARTVSVYKSPDSKVTQTAIAELLAEKYKPALCKGQPCGMKFVLKLDLLKLEYNAERH